jgi:N-ethylmaleimide reductase
MSQDPPGEPPTLFTPYRLNGLMLPNRIVMAPMTRSRSRQPGDVPTELNALYYSQRASAGLIVTEATQISAEGKGYAWTPGIHSPAPRDGWRLVTEAVHAAGGRIFLQLWHVGRVSLSAFQPWGQAPVAPSAIPARDTKVYAVDDDGVAGMILTDPPRALQTAEIARVVDDFRRAAGLAMQAGFDGVEIDGGNGYLIDQFLRTATNQRTDRYGGSTANRIRFLAEVSRAVAREVGAGRTGVRLAPYITFKDMADPEIIDTILAAAEVLADQEVSYIHLSEADWDDAPVVPESFRVALRERFAGAIIVAGRYDLARAAEVLDAGYADLVAFGRPFVANPGLPERLRLGLPLAEPDLRTLFGGGAAGYTDYLD